MKNTIIELICDDCHNKIKEIFLTFHGYDFCKSCVLERLFSTFKEHPVGKKCGFCENGTIKSCDGYNGWAYETCRICHGSGLAFWGRENDRVKV